MNMQEGTDDFDLSKRKRQRQILSCKNCKLKKVKCQPELNTDILASLPPIKEGDAVPCKQCIKRGAVCEYFQRVDTKKEALLRERSRKREEKLLKKTAQGEGRVPKPRKKRKPKAPAVQDTSFPLENRSLLNGETILGASSDALNADIAYTSDANRESLAEIDLLASTKPAAVQQPNSAPDLGYSALKTTPGGVSGPNLIVSAMTPSVLSPGTLMVSSTGATLKDLASVVSNEPRTKSFTATTVQQGFFANGLPNPMSPKSTSQYSSFGNPNNTQPTVHSHPHSHVHNHSTTSLYQSPVHKHHAHQTHQPQTHSLISSNRLFSVLPQRTPSITSPPSTGLKVSHRIQQKRSSPIEINNILKPIATSPFPSQLQHLHQPQGSGLLLNSLNPHQQLPLLQNQSHSIPDTPSFADKYFASQATMLLENPMRKLDLYSIQKEAVFSCSAVSVRPWFEHSHLVKKHKALFDNLKEKSHARRDKEKGCGIGSIKKDRMLLMEAYDGRTGTLMDEIVSVLPEMPVFREIIVAYFNSDLHLYFRILDRVSVFNALDKYFDVENAATVEDNEELESSDEKSAEGKILGLNLTPNDNFFNVAIIFQVYRIVMGKHLTEKEDDLFRTLEIHLNGLSSGYIWSFTKLQFSLLCYLQRHLDLEMSDFSFNFKILAEHIASSCLKTGLNKGVHNFISSENKVPEWTLRNLYLWAHYFDLIHALESGSPLIIPFDPITEEHELKRSERGQDGLLRRFVLLGRRIVNALYEPYGRPDIEGMLKKICEFERLELLPLNSYCNLSTISNVDLYDYSVLIPLMNIKITLKMIRYFVDNESESRINYNGFFGICFAILAIIIVLREQWQNSLLNKELVLYSKEPKTINIDHLSYFHSLAVQRDLLDKVGITFYEILYQLRTHSASSEENVLEAAGNYTSDDILSYLISFVLLKQPLPEDLILKHEDIFKSFMILVERFYRVDTFGKEKQPNIHFKDFETIFRNIYTGNSNLEAALTPRFTAEVSQPQLSSEIYNNQQLPVGESVSTINGVWQKPANELLPTGDSNPPITGLWSEEDDNILQLFDVDFTTFLTPFL